MENKLTREDRQEIKNYFDKIIKLTKILRKSITFKLKLSKMLISIYQDGRINLLTEDVIDYLAGKAHDGEEFIELLEETFSKNVDSLINIESYLSFLREIFFYIDFFSDHHLEIDYDNEFIELKKYFDNLNVDKDTLAITRELVFLNLIIKKYQLDINIDNICQELSDKNSYDWLELNDFLTKKYGMTVFNEQALKYILDNQNEKKSIGLLLR